MKQGVKFVKVLFLKIALAVSMDIIINSIQKNVSNAVKVFNFAINAPPKLFALNVCQDIICTKKNLVFCFYF